MRPWPTGGLPFDAQEFDAVLCECSLCTFAHKPAAVGEMRRVLRPGGRLALCDVVVDPARLPDRLAGPLAAIACVGEAIAEAIELVGLARRTIGIGALGYAIFAARR